MSADIANAFRGLADQAIALEDSMANQEPSPAAVPQVETKVEPQPETTQVQEAQAQSQQPEPVNIDPDTPVRIKVDGVEKVVKMSEYKEILQRTDVFTQRQQALAKQRQELEQFYVQREAQVQQAVRAIQQAQLELAQRQSQPQPQAKPQVNPQEIATIGEMQQALQTLAQQYEQARQFDQQNVQQLLEQKAQQVREEIEILQDQKRVHNVMNEIMQSEDGRLLADVSDEAEKQIRWRVTQMQPQNTDQAIEFLHQVAKEWAGKVRGKLTVQEKQQQIVKAKNVMEAPSGAVVPVAKTGPTVVLDKYGNVNTRALLDQALSVLE